MAAAGHGCSRSHRTLICGRKGAGYARRAAGAARTLVVLLGLRFTRPSVVGVKGLQNPDKK
jgi:hypothetical protein